MIFGQIPWIIPFGKSRFFALFKTLYFWCKNHSFLSIISKNNISDLISPKNRNKKNFDSWAKTEDYPLRKMSIFLDFLKLQFSGLKLILFYPEHQKTIFWNKISSKTLMRKSLNFGQKPCTNLLGKDRCFGAPQNVTFLV